MSKKHKGFVIIIPPSERGEFPEAISWHDFLLLWRDANRYDPGRWTELPQEYLIELEKG